MNASNREQSITKESEGTTINRPCVRIEGTTGRYAGAVNGLYEATTESSGDMPIYLKVDDGVCLEYMASVMKWYVKLVKDRGKEDRYYACCRVPTKCYPEQCSDGWEVMVGNQKIPQPVDIIICAITTEQLEAYLDEVEQESDRVVKGSHNIRIAGATGENADLINGLYKPTDELSANVSVYVKTDDGDLWLEYRTHLHQWQVKTTKDKGTDQCHAYCTVPHKCFPQECPVGEWEVVVDEVHVNMAAVTIHSEVNKEDINIIIRRLSTVDAIMDSTGPTPRTGRKGTNTDMITPHASGRKNTLTDTLSMLAPLASARKNTLTDMLGPLTGRKISTLSTQSVDTSGGKRQTHGHGHGHLRSSLKGDPHQFIRISGAVGAQAGKINGVYKPVLRTSLEEVTTQATFYVKCEDGNRWLEYRATVKQWQAKPTADKDTDVCTACCVVPAKCLPQECPLGQWKVDDGDDGAGFVPQSDLAITAMTIDDLEEYQASLQQEAIKIATNNYKFQIAGATGDRADEINGMYEASTTLSLRGDMPVYAKVGNNDIRLVYNSTNKQWQIRVDSHLVALCLIENKGPPGDCLPTQWQVWDGTQLHRESDITIVPVAHVHKERGGLVSSSILVPPGMSREDSATCGVM